MTKTEIFEAVDTMRDTLIEAHVQLQSAMDQVEHLKQKLQEDIAAELAARN